MDEDSYITITTLNDFLFCPISIYYHNMYGDTNALSYKSIAQTQGVYKHKTIDDGKYNNRDCISGIDVISNKYGLIGKIDIYNKKNKSLIERKSFVKEIYDGYILQLYGQYYCMTEMGYKVDNLYIHSLKDNKTYFITRPEENNNCRNMFNSVLKDIKEFDVGNYWPDMIEKCKKCIYSPACNRSLYVE